MEPSCLGLDANVTYTRNQTAATPTSNLQTSHYTEQTIPVSEYSKIILYPIKVLYFLSSVDQYVEAYQILILSNNSHLYLHVTTMPHVGSQLSGPD